MKKLIALLFAGLLVLTPLISEVGVKAVSDTVIVSVQAEDTSGTDCVGGRMNPIVAK